jgi:SNF2 family DNA or RNA helicase
MAENQSEDRKRKTTLIIAPVALLEQWEQEIRRFVKHKWRIHLYHGKGNKISLAQMKHCDIILTSFGQVANALPSEKPGPNDDSSDDMNKRGDLLKMNWYRVCVDEVRSLTPCRRRFVCRPSCRAVLRADETMVKASQIRNSRTKSAKAIYQLKSTYRWILSGKSCVSSDFWDLLINFSAFAGTLVVNTLVDLFSPLYFLNISELSVWENFRDKVQKLEKRRPDLAVKRVQAVLKYACKRRTADSKIDGQPILTLPPKTLVKRMPAFDQDERTVYDVIEARAIARFNKFLKANTVLKNYAHVLTMILRLRQICNHVSLVCRKPGEQGHADE